MRESVLYVGGAACEFPTLTAALEALGERGGPATIYMAAGEYRETPVIRRDGLRVVGLGDVKIIGDRGAVDLDEAGAPLGTFGTATLLVNAERICLENLTIVNAAGPGERAGQALALYLFGREIEARHCRLLGHQDTLCVGPLPESNKEGTPMPLKGITRVYPDGSARFEGCYIEGTVDFIFGGGRAAFHGCQLHSLARPEGKEGYLTAACTPRDQPEGFVFTDCLLSAAPGAENVYLGRPWRPWAHTAFVRCRMGPHIRPEGWSNWGKAENERTARYREEGNVYLGAVRRPGWVDFRE